jgi:nucleoside-diphosphate-sugar epimerase
MARVLVIGGTQLIGRALVQQLLARGDEVWVYHYKDDLAARVAARPDIFKKVR